MNKLCINLFTMYEHRQNITRACLKQLDKVNEKLKYGVLLRIFCLPEHENFWTNFAKTLYMDIDLAVMGLEYIKRTELACNNSYNYSIRVDDDLFIPCNLWTWILENLNFLDNSNVHAMMPMFSTSIPTVDYFVNSFMDREEKELIGNQFIHDAINLNFLNTHGNHGGKYNHIYDKIKSMNEWNSLEYWKEVRKNSSIYRTTHPIRFSQEANDIMFRSISSKFDKLMNSIPNGVIEFSKDPVSHWFCTKTDIWKQCVEHRVDAYDETSMNLHFWKNNMVSYIIKNGWAIHCCFNYIKTMNEIENKYSNLFMEYGLLND